MADPLPNPKHEVNFWFDSHGEFILPEPAEGSSTEKTTLGIIMPCRYGDGAAWHTDVAHDYLIALYVAVKLPQLESWSCSEESLPDKTGRIVGEVSCVILRSDASTSDDVAPILNELMELFQDESDGDDADDSDLIRTEELSEFQHRLCAGEVPIPKNLGQLADVFMEYLLLGEAELRSSDGRDDEEEEEELPYENRYWISFEGKALGIQLTISDEAWIVDGDDDLSRALSGMRYGKNDSVSLQEARVTTLREYPETILHSRTAAVRFGAAQKSISDALIYLATTRKLSEAPSVSQWRLTHDGSAAVAAIAGGTTCIVGFMSRDSRSLDHDALIRAVQTEREEDVATLREAIGLTQAPKAN